MKKIVVQRIVGVVVICLITCLCIYGLGYIVRPTDTDRAYAQIETFHSLPENSVEVLVYGSSHAYRGVNVMEMYNQYGIGAYNYAWNWQRANTMHLFVKDSLEVQTPRIALIETYHLDEVLMDTNMTAEIFYSRYIHSGQARQAYLKQCFGNDKERYLSYYMPLCAFHDNWNTLTQQSFEPLAIPDSFRLNMGFLPSDKITKVKLSTKKTSKQAELSEASRAEVLAMLETLRQKGVRVIFFTVPWGSAFRYHDTIAQLAQENDCDYIDFFELVDEIGMDGNTDFSDKGHLNTSGATKIANYLGRYIKEHYEVTDMRTVENNLWER